MGEPPSAAEIGADSAPSGSALPWSKHGRDGWRYDVLSGEADGDFVLSVVEADLAEPVRWVQSLDGEGLLLRVTLAGRGEVELSGAVGTVLAATITAVALDHGAEFVQTYETGRHQLVDFRFSGTYLRSLLGTGDPSIREGLVQVLEGRRLAGEKPMVLNEPLTAHDRGIAESVAKPPVAGMASGLWFRAKAMELLSGWCCREPHVNGQSKGDRFFCSQQKRAVMERVEKSKAYLAEHLEEPLELAAVARAASCSPHYLSRLFKAETGMTLSRYLRGLRVDRACEFLATGRMNVSEAAIEVGYQSLSHFARAFHEEKGMTPSEYLSALEAGVVR